LLAEISFLRGFFESKFPIHLVHCTLKQRTFMKTKIWLAMLAIYLIWGSTYLGIRFAIETIPPFLSAAIRFLISSIIILSWRKLAGDPWPTARQWRDAAIVGLLLLVGGNGLVSYAEMTLPSGVAALVVGSVPLWLTLFEALRRGGIKPGWQTLAGLVVGFGGIFLLVGPNQFGGSLHLEPIGTMAIISATILWALGSIYSKNADMPASTILWTGMEMTAGTVGLFAMSALNGEFARFNLLAVSTRSWLGLLYLITFGSLIAFVSYAWLLRNAPIALIATYAYVNPVVAIFLGAWLASEVVTARILIAATIIIGSVILINFSRQAQVIQQEEVTTPIAD
jgi:drug/metabolite transporter (DMT)-like permease